MVITLGQQYNVGEKPTVILYTYTNRHAGKGHDIKQNNSKEGSPPIIPAPYFLVRPTAVPLLHIFHSSCFNITCISITGTIKYFTHASITVYQSLWHVII